MGMVGYALVPCRADGCCRGAPLTHPTKPSSSGESTLRMPAAIERGKRRVHGAPAECADLAFDHNATVGKDEIGTIAATLVFLRVVLIPSGGLCQLLLILRLVILSFSSRCAPTSGGRDSADRFDKCPPR